MTETFFDEMFIGLMSALLQNPEDGYYRKMLLHEYFSKKYLGVFIKQKGQSQDAFYRQVYAFNKEIRSVRLSSKKKNDLICKFFDLIVEEVYSTQEINSSSVNVNEELSEIVYYKRG